MYLQPYGETHAIWTQGGDEFLRATSQDTVTGMDGKTRVSDQASIWRWRSGYQNDFAARMDWTVKDYAHANHAPQVVVNGAAGTEAIEVEVEAGKTITLDAAGTSDPDGQAVKYKWELYPEAGRTGLQGADVELAEAETSAVKVTAKSACRAGWLPGYPPCGEVGVMHIILTVTDNGTPELRSYRRVIVKVRGKKG